MTLKVSVALRLLLEMATFRIRTDISEDRGNWEEVSNPRCCAASQ
jgi:hypothetical protein